MVIRPIRREELAEFAAFSDQTDRNTALAATLEDWLSGDQTHLEWLIVAEDEGAFAGRIAYTTDSGLSHPPVRPFLRRAMGIRGSQVAGRVVPAQFGAVRWRSRRPDRVFP